MQRNNGDCIDIFLNNYYFHNKQNGFYLQAGAYDGISDSITYPYYKQLNWKGILIQPNINLIDNIKSIRSSNNIIINAGLSNKTQILQYQYLPSRADGGGFNLSNQQKQQLKCIGYNGISQKYKIQVYAYKDIIQMYKITNIDIAVIDVEGYQNKVLTNIIQSIVKPKFIVVQFIHSNINELVNILQSQYKLLLPINKDLIFQRI